MKYILLVLTLASLGFAKVATISIEGMTCPLCTTAVKKSLTKIEGVSHAKVILNTKMATVNMDDTVSEKELLDAVKDDGYSGKIESIKEE